MSKFGQCFHRSRFSKTHNLKIARMYSQQQSGVLSDSCRVIAQASAICCADLYQLAAALTHHIWNPETSAYLNELTSRDDNLATRCQRTKG